jgi:hypothetical protein
MSLLPRKNLILPLLILIGLKIALDTTFHLCEHFGFSAGE